MPLMPNSSGVYANSVQGINNAAAQQNMTPQLNAAGNYGTDPITGAPMLDKFAAQTKLAALSNPNSLDSQYLASQAPTMRPTSAPSGPVGRMGPQKPRRKIMTLGPRTAAEYTAERGSTLDNAYAAGNLTNPNPAPNAPAALPANGTLAPEPGLVWNDETGWEKPQMMAKGGAMKPGKPYLVGEEGPELIMPRQNGEGFVLPADVTAQILPTMRNVTPRKNGGQMPYTPRAEGGIMTLNTPNARFAGGATPYGPAFAMTQTESQMGSPQPMTIEEAGLAMQPDQRMIVSDGYQVDLPALTAPGNQTIPLQPDSITGPWASPALPADTSTLRPYLQNQVSRLSMAGATPASRYPDQLFQDTAFAARTSRYDKMAKGSPEEMRASMAQGRYALSDPFIDSADTHLTFEELRDRVALRGMMYGDDFRDRNARNQTQLDLAARANRAPLGSAPAPVSQIPGMPAMRPSTQRAIERNQERFLRTPEGAAMMLGNAQRQAELQQRTQLASTAIPVTDPATGQILGYTTGTGASLPNMNRPRTVQRTAEIDGQYYNFFDDGTAEPIANVPRSPGKQTVIDRIGGKIIELPAGVDISQLPPESYTVLNAKSTPEIGGAKTDTTNPASTEPITITGPDDPKLKTLTPGTVIILPSGKRAKVPAR